MSDINCPYCNAEQDINHVDGYGYAEDETHKQECSHCNKLFTYTTAIIFSYYPEKADCLNGDAEHDYQPNHTYPVELTEMECSACGETRKPTASEMSEIMANKGIKARISFGDWVENNGQDEKV